MCVRGCGDGCNPLFCVFTSNLSAAFEPLALSPHTNPSSMAITQPAAALPHTPAATLVHSRIPRKALQRLHRLRPPLPLHKHVVVIEPCASSCHVIRACLPLHRHTCNHIGADAPVCQRARECSSQPNRCRVGVKRGGQVNLMPGVCGLDAGV